MNDLIVLIKDADFKNSFLISNTPKKLIKVNLGNISTSVLVDVISINLQAIQNLYSMEGFLIELDKDSVTFIKKEGRIKPGTKTEQASQLANEGKYHNN